MSDGHQNTTHDNELVRTRQSLQQLAEHVVAGDLWRHTSRIGLRPTPGGFGQPECVVDGVRRRIRIDGLHVVVLEGDIERWQPLSTLSGAAAFAGTSVGAPEGLYTASTVAEPDRPLDVSEQAAAQLADWFALVGVALEEVRRRNRKLLPTIVQLWPEHFDVACSLSEVNLGGSPGDADHAEPYLYVGPWAPVQGPAWNEAWGASISWTEIGDVDQAVAYLETGLGWALDA